MVNEPSTRKNRLIQRKTKKPIRESSRVISGIRMQQGFNGTTNQRVVGGGRVSEKLKLFQLRKETLEKAHLEESSNLGRQYFKELGVDWHNLTISHFERLSVIIQNVIDILLLDKRYDMIPRLKVNPKIRDNKDGISLRISGSYFSDREGVSFSGDWVGFCSEMSGCNRIPFLKGFVYWVDYLNDKNIGE